MPVGVLGSCGHGFVFEAVMDLAFDPATDLATDRSLWFALALDVAMPLDVAIVMSSFLIR
jgi:hypothetical protein